MSELETHLTNFRRLNGKAPAWLQQMREAAMSRFSELGFPTPRLEDWKYTNVAPIAKAAFELADSKRAAEISSRVARVALDTGSQLVFLNGRFVPEHSFVQGLPAGARVGSLVQAIESQPELLRAYLGRTALYAQRAFVALNTAFIQDGAVIHLPRNAVLNGPVHLVFLSLTAGEPTISHPRNLIVAEEDSEALVIESYVGAEHRQYCTNAVTEIVVGPNARLTHYRLQRESEAAFHIGTVEVSQQAHSYFHSHAVSLGGALVRTDVNATLDAEGTDCNLDGLYLAAGRQHVDHHTCIDHRKPHGTSRELYKGVLDGRATGVFNGKVFVRPDAQSSDAGQVNKNLLLSPDAVIDTKPQLEIFADDVKCSHGATIGRLSEGAIFYLRSRGIGELDARNLLVYAFANELVERIAVEPLRAQLDRVLWSRFRDSKRAEVSQ
jgi:Fe-S cluster assembly protein SufD